LGRAREGDGPGRVVVEEDGGAVAARMAEIAGQRHAAGARRAVLDVDGADRAGAADRAPEGDGDGAAGAGGAGPGADQEGRPGRPRNGAGGGGEGAGERGPARRELHALLARAARRQRIEGDIEVAALVDVDRLAGAGDRYARDGEAADAAAAVL